MTTSTIDEIRAPRGLAGVVVTDTAIGAVRGEEGFYHYREYSAPDLARHQSFEAVWHLLHVGHLPDDDELARFRAETAAQRPIPAAVADALSTIVAAAPDGAPMAAARTALSLLATHDGLQPWLETGPDELHLQARRLVAGFPTLVGALWRLRNGEAPVVPDQSLGLAADHVRMITGTAPTPEHARAVERYLILTVDHGLNASTFTARTVASTGADLGAVTVAALGSLSGPLHGAAPSRVLEMLLEIGDPSRADAWVQAALARHDVIMGFGHRVYRTEDPRSALLKETALEMGGPLVELAVEVEDVILAALDRHRPGRDLRTNVEYYASVVLHLVGLPADLFTPTFAVSRMIGWTAHAIEQTVGNRIFRPSSRYVGPTPG
jgi:citrate synthase